MIPSVRSWKPPRSSRTIVTDAMPGTYSPAIRNPTTTGIASSATALTSRPTTAAIRSGTTENDTIPSRASWAACSAGTWCPPRTARPGRTRPSPARSRATPSCPAGSGFARASARAPPPPACRAAGSRRSSRCSRPRRSARRGDRRSGSAQAATTARPPACRAPREPRRPLVPAARSVVDQLGWVLQVGVDRDDHVPGGVIEPGGERRLVAEVPGEAHHPHPRVAARQGRAAAERSRRSSHRPRPRAPKGRRPAPRRAARRRCPPSRPR